MRILGGLKGILIGQRPSLQRPLRLMRKTLQPHLRWTAALPRGGRSVEQFNLHKAISLQLLYLPPDLVINAESRLPFPINHRV